MNTNGRKVRGFEEPWLEMEEDGVYQINGDGYSLPMRSAIKTSRSAPHLAVCMPVGGREYYDIAVCEHCNQRTRIRPGESYHGPGLIPVELFSNFMHVMSPLNVVTSFYTLKNHLSAVLRESMTDRALAAGANYIFYWDDDTLIPPDTWYRMMIAMAKNPDVGLITGVYFQKKVPTEPVLYKHAGGGAHWGYDKDPDAPLEDIFAAGAGCMMVRAEVFKTLEKPYWHDVQTANEDWSAYGISGHDIRFCRKIHEETGYRVTVDGSIQCMHFDVKAQKGYMEPKDCPPTEMAREVIERDAATDVPAEKPEDDKISPEEVTGLFEEKVDEQTPVHK